MVFTLGDFDSSMNFITGFSALDDDFDILNNPYIEVFGYELTVGTDFAGQLNADVKYTLELCRQDDLDRFMESHVQSWFD